MHRHLAAIFLPQTQCSQHTPAGHFSCRQHHAARVVEMLQTSTWHMARDDTAQTASRMSAQPLTTTPSHASTLGALQGQTLGQATKGCDENGSIAYLAHVMHFCKHCVPLARQASQPRAPRRKPTAVPLQIPSNALGCRLCPCCCPAGFHVIPCYPLKASLVTAAEPDHRLSGPCQHLPH